MTYSRRKAMGIAAAGMLAGPKMLDAAMESDGPRYHPAPPSTGFYGGGSEIKQVADEKWTLENLAKMKRLASGDIRDEDRNYPTEGSPSPFRALRSVSEDARHFMRGRRYEEQWRERMIKTARDALDHWDKTGILRTFF